MAQSRPRNAAGNLFETQLLVAVSRQNAALGPWNVYQTPINFPGLIPVCPAPSGCFGDYPTLGVDDNGIWWVDSSVGGWVEARAAGAVQCLYCWCCAVLVLLTGAVQQWPDRAKHRHAQTIALHTAVGGIAMPASCQASACPIR
jgi:hypothetical protein